MTTEISNIATARSFFHLILLTACMSLTVTSCSDRNTPNEDSTPTTTTTAQNISRYPSFTSHWDSAIELSEPEMEAAKFAAETEALNQTFMLSRSFDPNLMARYNERVVPEYSGAKSDWDRIGGHGEGDTGATQLRIVDVNHPDESYRVTLCEFDTPGLYNIINGQAVHGDSHDRALEAVILTIAETTQPSAADRNEKSPSRRMLVTSFVDAVHDNKSPDVLCDRFAPEPFIQTPPSPLPTGAGHK